MHQAAQNLSVNLCGNKINKKSPSRGITNQNGVIGASVLHTQWVNTDQEEEEKAVSTLLRGLIVAASHWLLYL